MWCFWFWFSRHWLDVADSIWTRGYLSSRKEQKDLISDTPWPNIKASTTRVTIPKTGQFRTPFAICHDWVMMEIIFEA